MKRGMTGCTYDASLQGNLAGSTAVVISGNSAHKRLTLNEHSCNLCAAQAKSVSHLGEGTFPSRTARRATCRVSCMNRSIALP